MDIYYLDQCIYRFQRKDDGLITVFKSPQKIEKWISWAQYIPGKMEFAKADYDGRCEYRITFSISDDNDPLDEVQALMEEKHCVRCGQLISCPADVQTLHSWQYQALLTQRELSLALLEVPPLCLNCVNKMKNQEAFQSPK